MATVDSQSSPAQSGAKGAALPARPERSLVGWTVILALALTGLAALGVIWFRGKRQAAQTPVPADALLHRIDINKASAEELDLLPGIGKGRKDRIIEAREKRGGFKRLVELDDPELLGPGASARLAPYLEPLPGGQQ